MNYKCGLFMSKVPRQLVTCWLILLMLRVFSVFCAKKHVIVEEFWSCLRVFLAFFEKKHVIVSEFFLDTCFIKIFCEKHVKINLLKKEIVDGSDCYS